ncbi:uncharacterized protein LOC111617332, partial [Centruroides sculpturatus]|uniref:uncharacterized protein LOC111617332 n=1 Tax=Centruroides sculpturatus TaxID=218467 RepID=UPI000C6D0B92
YQPVFVGSYLPFENGYHIIYDNRYTLQVPQNEQMTDKYEYCSPPQMIGYGPTPVVIGYVSTPVLIGYSSIPVVIGYGLTPEMNVYVPPPANQHYGLPTQVLEHQQAQELFEYEQPFELLEVQQHQQQPEILGQEHSAQFTSRIVQPDSKLPSETSKSLLDSSHLSINGYQPVFVGSYLPFENGYHIIYDNR